MEVKMNKEIRDYQESMFMGLDLRQCVCSVLAILTAIGIYFGMRDITGQEITGWLCVLGAAPFAACGFFKYHGMTAEQFLWAVIKSELLYPKKLVFQSEDIYQIGYLPEERGLYKKMKVGEQAIYLAQLKGLSYQEARIRLIRLSLIHISEPTRP